jgi:hypothetical protein
LDVKFLIIKGNFFVRKLFDDISPRSGGRLKIKHCTITDNVCMRYTKKNLGIR